VLHSIRTILLILAVTFSTQVEPAGAQPAPLAAPSVDAVAIEGTEFVVRLSDRRSLRSRDLVGAVLNIRFGGKPVRIRLNAVERDPEPTGTVWLHSFEMQGPDGSWREHCTPGPDGRRQGFPLAGGPDGPELVCTSGGYAKCVRFGYRRWAATQDGTPLAPLHAACMRMLRGDYGGDHPFTKDGMKIQLYDFSGVNAHEDEPAETFEAGWDTDGAVCVHHVRVKENVTLAELEARYPRLRGRTGAICTAEFARSLGALMFNHSEP
jgi:hypothetical protein